ncbi:Vegetative incompatibility protein HET-E-1 [Cytospora mali]|uniref:Vegetative incompatibility protein HET-E-1 n=1 Tax=Cytospora mali TaxID=578113 RepID=A0A194UNV4_CYTMA|nr:Vegetative incompatibility protein HET-E-1 [Valsa mali var. pyri (nom. inval.)]
MRLMNTTSLVIQEFPSEEELPEFAILSHTWGKTGEECSLQDMTRPGVSAKPGYRKIKLCCDQALIDGLEWAWVDTCCIDKTSTAELSEAINSMYRWYGMAKICYAYLVDVKTQEDLAKSKWFTRGWTLQELLAPRDVRFYSGAWQCIGSKFGLKSDIYKITGIDEAVLTSGRFDGICVAQRMSWAANRHTTRTEDKSYSLMGIFGVNMPLLYGEGEKAFLRLQEEILKTSDDHSLFAWGLPKELVVVEASDFLSREKPEARELRGIFANSPTEFVSDHHLQQVNSLRPDMPPIVSANGVHIRLPVSRQGWFTVAAISCIIQGDYHSYIGLVLYQWDRTCLGRLKDLVLISASHSVDIIGLLIKAPTELELPSQSLPIFQISIDSSTTNNVHVRLVDVYEEPHALYSKENDILSLPDGPTQGLHATLLLRTYKGDKTGDWGLFIGGHASDGQSPWAVLARIRYKKTLAIRFESGVPILELPKDSGIVGTGGSFRVYKHNSPSSLIKMRSSAAQLFATIFTLCNSALATSTGPFYLTIVPEDGSDTYPATVATVSRGAQILSSALEYDQLFTYDITSARIFKNGSTTLGNGPLSAGSVILFNSPSGTAGSALEQVIVDGNVFLVKNGTAEDGIYAWSSSPTTTGLAVQVEYEGGGSSDANSALMLDVVLS